jgi:hypothetical protein
MVENSSNIFVVGSNLPTMVKQSTVQNTSGQYITRHPKNAKGLDSHL